MRPGTPPPAGSMDEEVAALVRSLHESELRLEALTGGEVDAVADREGRTFLLRRAQDRLRQNDAARQAAILNALPAHIALLDTQGGIISVNEVWRRFARENGLPGCGIGANYIEICDSALGDESPEAHKVAAGIRSVLGGGEDSFSLEYPCHSPTEQRWFLLTVTPVADDRRNGAVVMHLNVTERKQIDEALRKSEMEFRTLAEAMPQIVWITLPDGSNIYTNQQWTDYTGKTNEESLGNRWKEPFHPDDRQRARDAWQEATATHKTYSTESRLRRADGVYRWWLIRGVPSKDTSGTVLKWFGTCTDIHDMKVAELKISRANKDLLESEIGIKRLNRVYAVLSGITSLIVRASSRDELFEEACRIAVEEGGFLMAMIAIADPSAETIVPVATAGKDKELHASVSRILSSVAGAPTTMIGQTIREKNAVVANDSQNDSRVLLRRQFAESGVRSIAVLPLIVSDVAVGALALYASEAQFFHEDELKLLTGLAGDVAFAIDHIEKQERLDYLAYYDVLTGLANRALFHERLEQKAVAAQQQGSKLALVLLDVERFKIINDTLGRQAGDALLKALGARMADFAVDTGRLARIDADHFAVMVTEVQSGEELARLIDQRYGEIFGPSFRIGNSELRVSAKFGVAMFPADGTDADTLFRNAEAALKNAKASGDRYLFYAQAMNERVAEKLSLEFRLRRALDNEEFVLHYQPKVNLVSGKVTGAEALIRWNDPRIGLVPPGQFIPILEETGLIHDVGRWALRQALSDYLRWRAAGLPVVRIAVNVSPLQLRNRDFIAELQQAISVDAAAAPGLELEITESVIMADVQDSIDRLKAIRALGIMVAIDDFGTGFSSLSYLSKLPVDTLKIDRSFVVDMTAGPDGLALVSTIISLAHAMKLKVVAEGVETEEQSRLLRLVGCDEMQGFLFSAPVRSEIFETKFLALAAAPAEQTNQKEPT